MNKRIDQLWGEALDRAVPDTYSSLSWTQVEKIKAVFAELIVKECIAKTDEESERYLSWNTEDCNRFSKVMQNYKELLKEHFGVEE